MVVYTYDDKIYHCFNQYVPGYGLMTYKKRVDFLRDCVFYDNKDILFWINKGKLYKKRYIQKDEQILVHNNILNNIKQFVIIDSNMLIGITYDNQIITSTLNPYHTAKIKIYGQPKQESIEVGYINYRVYSTLLQEDNIICFDDNCKIHTEKTENIKYLLGTYRTISNIATDDIMMIDQYEDGNPVNYEWFQRNEFFATKHKNIFADYILETNERYMMVSWKGKQFIYTDEDELYNVKWCSELYKRPENKMSKQIKSARNI